MQRGLGPIALVMLACSLAAAPASKSPALDAAVAALKREYAAHLKDPKSSPLRKACDYFPDPARAAIPPDALLNVLEKPLPGTDNRQCAYVKWQLLSALPQTLDEPTIGRLIKVYQRAPVPAPRYGISPREKREMDKLIPGARQQDDVRLTARLEAAVARGYELDRPITAFRDELYARLPMGRVKFLAGMNDAAARLGVAGEKERLAELLAAEMKQWASDASAAPADVREVAEALGKLRFVETPPYYVSAAARRGRLTWVTDTDTLLSSRRLTTLHKTLLEVAGDPVPTAPVAKRNGKN